MYCCIKFSKEMYSKFFNKIGNHAGTKRKLFEFIDTMNEFKLSYAAVPLM